MKKNKSDKLVCTRVENFKWEINSQKAFHGKDGNNHSGKVGEEVDQGPANDGDGDENERRSVFKRPPGPGGKQSGKENFIDDVVGGQVH